MIKWTPSNLELIQQTKEDLKKLFPEHKRKITNDFVLNVILSDYLQK